MAYRCNVGNHTNCTACEKFVDSTDKDHIHIWRGGRYGLQQLCGDCWLRAAGASIPVLQALKNVGADQLETFDQLAFIREHVFVGIDLPMNFAYPSPN